MWNVIKKKLLLFSLLSFTNGYHILGVFPMNSVSHFKVFHYVMEGLARKGHNVTVISHFPLANIVSNYKTILLEDNNQSFVNFVDMDRFRSTGYYDRIFGSPFRLLKLANITCQGLGSTPVQNLLKSKQTFDVILMEYFNSDCFSVIADKFDCPVIGLCASVPFPWITHRLGIPLATEYITNFFLGLSKYMSFPERVLNTAVTCWNLYFYYIIINSQDMIYTNKYYTGKSSAEIVKNRTSLVLVNTHFSLNLPRALVPNMIEIGGIVPTAKALPKNLEKWISESKDGVIYFSLGSLIKGHTISKEKKDAFLKAFSRLPQRVLWKWENETMEGKPDNVMIQKWMPQFDILSHPNVKVFISHGGLLGTMEAVHCGVPIIVMPQFGDQPTNAKAIEANGGGVILPLSEVTEETAYKALKTVLSSSFREKAKQLSERFRDRPLSPLDTAIYWVEYVARHKGAPHMRTAAVDMPFYQYYLLDVFGFIFAVIAAFIYAIYFICKLILRKCINNVKLKQS